MQNNDQNLSLLYNLELFTSTEFPVLVGPSRKRFIGEVLKETNPEKRLMGTPTTNRPTNVQLLNSPTCTYRKFNENKLN